VKIYGIDIIRGSVRSKSRRPLYALHRIEDGEATGEGEVTGFRLRRILAEEEPDILAVDSIQEVATDRQELFEFLHSLPPSTRLVQVTGGERKETLQKVAARYNISFNRFDPHAEARTIAEVAALGAGVEVIAFEKESDIVVSRHRSPGRGGWSQNRYARKIHGAVLQKAREVEAELKAAGLKYEKKETRAFGGFSRVAFRVAAPRDLVPIRPFRGADVQVRVAGRQLDRLRYEPRSGRRRYLIVGLDPGTTTGIAAVDLDGNLVHLTSSRQMTMSDIIEELYRVGKPLIIATDVQQMPHSVEKIRRSFNAVPFVPKQSLSVEAKYDLTASHSYTNDHERDALSAALEAYRSYRNTFKKIAKRAGPGFDLDEVRARIVRGQPLDQVLADLEGRPEEPKEARPEVEEVTEQDERVIALDGMVKRLRGYVSELQDDMRKRDAEIERLNRLVRRQRSATERRVRRDAEIAKREAIIRSLKEALRAERRQTRRLKKRLDRMQTIADLERSEERTPIKVLESLTREAVRQVEEDLGLGEDDVLYVQRIDGWGRGVVKDLAATGIQALIVGKGTPEPLDPQLAQACREADLPLLHDRAIEAEIRGRMGSIEQERFKKALQAWEEEQQRYRREQQAERLEYLFKEYRTERGKEVRRGG